MEWMLQQEDKVVHAFVGLPLLGLRALVQTLPKLKVEEALGPAKGSNRT